MAYTPTEWETGDVITAEKLNKMEQGIAQSMQIVDVTDVQPFSGKIKYHSDFEAITAYPVPASYLAPNVLFLSEDPYVPEEKVMLANLTYVETETTAESVSPNYYVLPVGSLLKMDNSTGIGYYDETLTPTPGTSPS